VAGNAPLEGMGLLTPKKVKAGAEGMPGGGSMDERREGMAHNTARQQTANRQREELN